MTFPIVETRAQIVRGDEEWYIYGPGATKYGQYNVADLAGGPVDESRFGQGGYVQYLQQKSVLNKYRPALDSKESARPPTADLFPPDSVSSANPIFPDQKMADMLNIIPRAGWSVFVALCLSLLILAQFSHKVDGRPLPSTTVHGSEVISTLCR